MKLRATTPSNKNFMIGSLLMIMPVFFFFSVFMEQVAHNSWLVENIFARLDKINMGISAFMMIGFPVIAMMINLIPLMNINIKKDGAKINGNFSFTLKTLNIMVVLVAILTIGAVLSYLLVENYRHP